MQVLRGADKLAGAVRSALTLGTFAGLLGMLIVFYLLYQNAADALPVMNILLYLLVLWYIPSCYHHPADEIRHRKTPYGSYGGFIC